MSIKTGEVHGTHSDQFSIGSLSASDFTIKNITHVPGPGAYLYKIVVHSCAKIFDWKSTEWSVSDVSAIKRVLKKYHSQGGLSGELEYFARTLNLRPCTESWKSWIEFAVKSYDRSSKPYLDKLSDFFLEAEYDFLKNIEGDGDSQNYGEVWSLLNVQNESRSYTIFEINPV